MSPEPRDSTDTHKKIDNPTTDTWLADVHDQMLFVTLANGERRPYEVHLPGGRQSVTADEHLPVVLGLDGTTANKPYTGMAVDNKMNQAADSAGFMAVYPLPKPRVVGLGITKTMRDWNAPGVGAIPGDPKYNDEDYVKAVIADVNQRFHPQPGIFAATMSLGGEFLTKLSHDLPVDTFKKEYMVVPTAFKTEGEPAPGVPVKMVFGENDPVLSFEGGWKRPPQMGRVAYFLSRCFANTAHEDASSPVDMIKQLADVNGFSGSPKQVDHSTYVETTYPAEQTKTGVPIVVDTVKNAGHFWFGRETGGQHETIATNMNGVNPPVEAFDCSKDMVQFFGLDKPKETSKPVEQKTEVQTYPSSNEAIMTAVNWPGSTMDQELAWEKTNKVHQTGLGFDSSSNAVVAYEDEQGRKLTRTFDHGQNKVTTCYADGKQVQDVYDGGMRTTHRIITDADGSKADQTVLEDNRILTNSAARLSCSAKGQASDKEVHTMTFTYDQNGNLDSFADDNGKVFSKIATGDKASGTVDKWAVKVPGGVDLDSMIDGRVTVDDDGNLHIDR